jgi:nicotinate-nucleotide adenylyltransferase
MNIIIFGGAFDPPHLGHQQIIEGVLNYRFSKNLLADELWLVPTGTHDFGKKMTTPQHRLKMLELIIAALPQDIQSRVKVNLCELKRAGVNQTYDTLVELAEQHPQHQFSWVMGSDNLAKFHLWENYDHLMARFKVYIYPRAGVKLEPWYEPMTVLKKVKEMTVSSTQVRENLTARKSIDDLVLPEIQAYIREHQLY